MKRKLSVLCAALAVVVLLAMTLSACSAFSFLSDDHSKGNWLEGEYKLTGMRDEETDYSASLSLVDEQTLTIDEKNVGRGTLGDVDLEVEFDPYSDKVDDGTGVDATYTVNGDVITISQGDYVLEYTKK